MNKYIIYGLKDPITEEIRYIGKSVSGLERPREHFKPCNLRNNTHKINWIKSLLKKEIKPEIIIIEESSNPEDLYSIEAFWINYYKLNGNLTNCTDGFEGTLGRVCSDETRRKIGQKASVHRKGKPLPDGMNVAKQNVIIDGIEYRNCTLCKQDKELINFSFLKRRSTHDIYCKKCRVSIEKDYKKPKLEQEEYNKTRIAGARAGGLAIANNPKALENLSKKMSKAIEATNISTGEVLTFSSALEAKQYGFQNSNLGQAIRNNKPYKGYLWRFAA